MNKVIIPLLGAWVTGAAFPFHALNPLTGYAVGFIGAMWYVIGTIEYLK